MRPLYILSVCACLITFCSANSNSGGNKKKCSPLNTFGSARRCERRRTWQPPGKTKRIGGRTEKYPEYAQDNKQQAMKQLADETRSILVELLKEGRKNQRFKGGLNQYASYYDNDYLSYF